MRAHIRTFLTAFAIGFTALSAPVRAQEPLVVFAAASLKDALDDAAKTFKGAGGVDVKFSYAGSLALARQLEQGAPADIFASADQESMNYAASKNSIRPDSRFDLLQNKLVVIASKNSKVQSLAFTPDAFKTALGSGRLSTGEVNTVPVGRYAKSALEKLGLWRDIEPRLAMSDNVRAAMSFVARDEAPLGIVYATDAQASRAVRVVGTFPAASHPPIRYPLALLKTSRSGDAAAFRAFLLARQARAIFARHGFTAP